MPTKYIPTPLGWVEVRQFVVIVQKAVPRPMLKNNQSWRDISESVNRKNYDICLRCRRNFEEDEPIHLVITNDGGKWVCAKCNGEILANLPATTDTSPTDFKEY